MIAESAALGVAVGGIVALLINLLGLKKTIILFGIGYLLVKSGSELYTSQGVLVFSGEGL